MGVLKPDGLNMKINQEPSPVREQMYFIMQKSTLLIYVGRNALKVKNSYYKNRLVMQKNNSNNANSYSLLIRCPMLAQQHKAFCDYLI